MSFSENCEGKCLWTKQWNRFGTVKFWNRLGNTPTEKLNEKRFYCWGEVETQTNKEVLHFISFFCWGISNSVPKRTDRRIKLRYFDFLFSYKHLAGSSLTVFLFYVWSKSWRAVSDLKGQSSVLWFSISVAAPKIHSRTDADAPARDFSSTPPKEPVQSQDRSAAARRAPGAEFWRFMAQLVV